MGNLIKKIKKKNKKVIICGYGAVGKKSLLRHYLYGKFFRESWMTKGVEHFFGTVNIKNIELNIIFWVLAGQEQFRFMQRDFCKGADGAVLIFDLTMQYTLRDIEEWVELVRTYDQNLPILLVGNKSDLGFRSFDDDYILSYKEKYNLFDYIETSAETGKNVDKPFELLFNLILNRKKHERERKAIEIKLKKRLITIEQLIQ